MRGEWGCWGAEGGPPARARHSSPSTSPTAAASGRLASTGRGEPRAAFVGVGGQGVSTPAPTASRPPTAGPVNQPRPAASAVAATPPRWAPPLSSLLGLWPAQRWALVAVGATRLVEPPRRETVIRTGAVWRARPTRRRVGRGGLWGEGGLVGTAEQPGWPLALMTGGGWKGGGEEARRGGNARCACKAHAVGGDVGARPGTWHQAQGRSADRSEAKRPCVCCATCSIHSVVHPVKGTSVQRVRLTV